MQGHGLETLLSIKKVKCLGLVIELAIGKFLAEEHTTDQA